MRRSQFLPIESTAFLTEAFEEIGAVAVPDKLDARAILARLARRGRIRVEVNGAVFVGDLGDRVGDAGVERADQDQAVLAGDEALGDAAAGGRVRLGVGGDPLDLAPEHAAPGVRLLDGDADAAQIILARRRIGRSRRRLARA